MDTALGLGAVALLILANALFVLGEFSLVAVDRTRLEALADEGDRSAARVLRSVRRLSFELSGAQFGITITSIVLGFVGAPVLARVVAPVIDALPGTRADAHSGVSVVVALAVATVTQMVVGELAPKSLAIARPLAVARWVVRPFGWFAGVFGPAIRTLNASANAVVRLFGVEPRQELAAVRSLDELELLIHSSVAEGTLDPATFPLLSRALAFRKKTAAAALVPRGAVVSLSAQSSVNELVATSRRTGHSRFPVLTGEREREEVLGAVHVKDALRVPRARWDQTLVGELIQPVPIVPESRDLASLLTEMTSQGRMMAVVVDEYGDLAGTLTMEDIVEEIVGEIEDEYDRTQFRFVSRFGLHVVSGMAHADDLREQFGFEMPEGDYETLAGFLLARLGRIPESGESVEYEDWRFEIVSLDGRRIDRVRVIGPAGSEDGER